MLLRPSKTATTAAFSLIGTRLVRTCHGAEAGDGRPHALSGVRFNPNARTQEGNNNFVERPTNYVRMATAEENQIEAWEV